MSTRLKEFIQLTENYYKLSNNFSELNRMVEQLFDDKKPENISQHQELLENNKELSKEFLSALNGLRNFKLSSELAPAARKGLCVSLNSIIESSLYEICKFVYELKIESEISNTENLEKRLKKIINSDGSNPSNIKRYGLYLKEVLDIELPRFFEKDLPLINKVRNKITHQNGLLTEEDKTELEILLNNYKRNEKVNDPYYELVRYGVTIEKDTHNRDYIFLHRYYMIGVKGRVDKMFTELFADIRIKL